MMQWLHSWQQAWSALSRPATAPAIRRPGYQIPLAEVVQQRLTQWTPEVLVGKHGQLCAVFRLLGSDPGVTDLDTLKARLASLASYLVTSQTTTMQRQSASYLQPLDDYLAFLQHHQAQREHAAPLLAERLEDVAEALIGARDAYQARLGADYWVLAYQPSVGERLGAFWPRTRRKASVPGQAALEERCRLLAAALARAGIVAERVRGTALAALCNSAWDGTFAPTLAVSTEGTDLDPTTLAAWAREPEGELTLTTRQAAVHGSLVRSWYLCDVTGSVDETLVSSLAALPGVRVLQFWERMEMDEARRILRWNRLVTNAEQYLRPSGDVEDYDWQAKAQENDQHRARLAFWGEPIFRYRLVLQQWASSQEDLEERAETLELRLKDRAQLVVHPATFQQRESLEAGLPLGQCPFTPPARNLNAACLARLAYPAAADPLQPEGVWLGMALPSRLQVTRDLFALQNPVVELIGPMGSGKSMAQKFLLAQLIAQGYPGFVLDATGEYTATIQLLGGTILTLGTPGHAGLNPVHFDPADALDGDDPCVAGQTQFLDWVSAALHPLSELERSILGDAYDRALTQAGILASDTRTWDRPAPLLSDIYAALSLEPDEPDMGADNPHVLAKKLARALKPFALERYAALFNHADQLALGQEQLVCFDVHAIPKPFRLAFLQPLLAHIERQALRRHRYQGCVLVVDEGHLYLRDERSALFLEWLLRDGRKAKLLTLLTMHTGADSQRTDAADLAHKTAGATLLFRVNRQDLATCENLHLSALEQQLVVEQQVGECLFLTPEERLQLKILVPPAWYPAFTTKPDEVRALHLAAAEPDEVLDLEEAADGQEEASDPEEAAAEEPLWHETAASLLCDWPDWEDMTASPPEEGGSAGILTPRRDTTLIRR